MTSARLFAYLNTIAKLFEEEDKDVEGCCVVALLYDEAFRRSIAHRVMAKDPELDMDTAFASVDKAILGACKTKVTTRVRSLADDQIDKAKNANRFYNQAQWRMDEQRESPDCDRSKAKKNVWLLGKLRRNARRKWRVGMRLVQLKKEITRTLVRMKALMSGHLCVGGAETLALGRQ